jgi:hypothetical protein
VMSIVVALVLRPQRRPLRAGGLTAAPTV